MSHNGRNDGFTWPFVSSFSEFLMNKKDKNNNINIPNQGQMQEWDEIFARLKGLNPDIYEHRKNFIKTSSNRKHRLQKVLVANRGEIAKRFFFALHEEGIPSVAIITDPDIGQSWYDFAGEVVHIGDSLNYTNIDVVIGAAIMSRANAIYPGYGFLSENPAFVRRIQEVSELFDREIIFMGPNANVMESIGNKVMARTMAKNNGISLLDGDDDVQSFEQALESAKRIGYPVMIKLSAGGGGRGIIPCHNDDELKEAVVDAERLGWTLFRDSRFYVEKLVERPVHMEVQIFNGHAIGLRKCAVQRRHQKIIEESAQSLVDDSTALSMLAQAQMIAKISGYVDGCGVGTVEYLLDPEKGSFGFLEVNTRLQVEYAVTEQSLGIDLVRWQIALFDGREDDIPIQEALRNRLRPPSHAIECRIYAEDPADDYRPAPGLITEISLPTFNGVRCDFGFAAEDRVASMYDALVGKLIAYGSTREECLIRLERALQEVYVKGLHTNLRQLMAIVRHPEFAGGNYTNNILEDFPELRVSHIHKKGHSQERRGRSTIVLGTLTEYIQLVRKKSSTFINSLSFDLSGERRSAMSVPYTFNVVYNEENYGVTIYPVSLDKYYVLINGQYNGKVYLTSSNINRGEYIFRYGNGSYRLRVDKRTRYLVIKIKDRSNKVNYYRLAVSPEGIGEKKDPEGMIRTPFQCTFVSLADSKLDSSKKLAPGSVVKKGDALLVISSMKMETKISSPVDGTIEYLIEDGDLKRLVLGRTADGRILGKGIQEGDVLVVVKPDVIKDESPVHEKEQNVKRDRQLYPSDEIVYQDEVEHFFLKNPKKMMPFMLELLRAAMGGFICQPGFITELLDLFEKIDEKQWKDILTPKTEDKICSLITFYYNVLELFSPIVRDGFSFQEEFNYYIHNIGNYEYKPKAAFKDLLLVVLGNYGIDELKPSLDGDTNMNPVAFLNMQNAYFICYENKSIIKKLVEILSFSENLLSAKVKVLETIINYEQSEPDDSLAKFVKKLATNYYNEGRDVNIGSGSFSSMNASEFTNTLVPSAGGKSSDEILAKVLESLEGETKEQGQDQSTPPELVDRINILEKKSVLTNLYSPYKDIYIYSSQEGTSSYYIAFVIIRKIADDDVPDVPYSVIKVKPLGEMLEKAYRILCVYNLVNSRSNNRLEIIANDQILKSDPITNGIGDINFKALRDLSSVATKYDLISNTYNIFFYFDASFESSEYVNDVSARVYQLLRRDRDYFLDLLAERDPRNPYNAATDSREVHLYSMKKWPVEIWASETFDKGEYKEILIDTVDFNVPEGIVSTPVASKIYVGKLHGQIACFYMKDSRVFGGATGDLEGLKYAAAIYISYLKKWPFYIWNDGAGANIVQGLISINRGGEGFMMNAIASNLCIDDFRKYTSSCPGTRLGELLKLIDNKFFAPDSSLPQDGNAFFFTAVGVGSSAGLDVYGSSQAPVQIIFDSEQSYRTLTGSTVIRSVTGEDISNYEIGGARVMSKWAGIVDLVVGGKQTLISAIRRINDMFSFEEDLDLIQRIEDANFITEPGHFSESDVSLNVDDGNFLSFKHDYYGSGSLVSGFAKLGGRKVAVLGPRSPEGIRSYQSVIKAHDVLRSASRLNIPALLVVSGKWHQHAGLYDGSGIRARMDFVNVLSSFKSLKICIITDINAFHCLEIISNSDIIVFVKNTKTDAMVQEFVEGNAAFTVDSLPEAFDLAHKLVRMIYPLSKDVIEAVGKPNIPFDNQKPYDMLSSVITKITDGGDFIEFFSGMNAIKTQPNFITGIGLINGETTAILADQPLVLGGAADAPNTEKYRVFVQLANKLNIRILMLSNSSGFFPGTKQERIRLQAIGGEAIDVNVLGNVPVVSVVLNQNFGGRLIQAFGKFLRPGIYSMAREGAVMAVIGDTAAFELLKAKSYNGLTAVGKQNEAEEMKKQFLEERMEWTLAKNDAYLSGAIDELINDMANLREMIISGFGKAKERCRNAFLK